MSVTAITTNAETGGKLPYIKESVLLAVGKPTKIILRFIVSFKKEHYLRLLTKDSPNLIISTKLKIEENSADLLVHRMIQAELIKKATRPYEYRFKTPNDQETAERYLDEIDRFIPIDELSDNWAGLCWQPRNDIEALEFYVPLKAKLIRSSNTKENTKIQEIRIELPGYIPPILERKVNLGLMIEFKTADIPSIRDNTVITTSIDLYNWKGIRKDFFERSHMLTPIAGELWIKYPLSAIIAATYPKADGFFVDTIEDEKIAEEISLELYHVWRLDEYMPAASKMSVRWNLDRHIKSWIGNEVSFVSTAFLFEQSQKT